MKKFAIASILTLATAATTQAATYSVTALSNTPGSVGYDPDKAAPTVTADGFHASGGVGDYNSVRFAPDAIGMAGLVAGQITAVSYTAANAVAGTLDWRLKLYTVNETTGQTGWYGFRIEAPTTTSGTTATFHPLLTYDRITKGDQSLNLYANSDGSLPPAFLSALGEASTQKVLFIDISAGANNGGYAYDTTLNNINVTANGVTSTIVAVPEPTTLAAIAGGALLLLGRRRRRA